MYRLKSVALKIHPMIKKSDKPDMNENFEPNSKYGGGSDQVFDEILESLGMRDKITETPTFSISKMTNDKIAKNIETPLLRSDHTQSHKEQQVQSSSKQRKNRTKEKRKKRKSAKERRKWRSKINKGKESREHQNEQKEKENSFY